MAPETTAGDANAALAIPEADLYFIETYFRQRGDHATLLAIDALVLRTDITDAQRAVMLQDMIQGAINGER